MAERYRLHSSQEVCLGFLLRAREKGREKERLEEEHGRRSCHDHRRGDNSYMTSSRTAFQGLSMQGVFLASSQEKTPLLSPFRKAQAPAF